MRGKPLTINRFVEYPDEVTGETVTAPWNSFSAEQQKKFKKIIGDKLSKAVVKIVCNNLEFAKELQKRGVIFDDESQEAACGNICN